MGTIKDLADAAFRDFAIVGLPASGANDPVKAEIRAVFAAIEQVTGAVAAGIKVFQTKGALDATTGARDYLAYVRTGSDAGVYSFNGSAWVLDTVYTSGVAAVVQPLVDEATEQVDRAEAAAINASRVSPARAETLAAARGVKSSAFTGATVNADGSVTVAGGGSGAVFYDFDAAELARVAAGGSIDIIVPIISGAPAAVIAYEYQGDTLVNVPRTLPVEGRQAILRDFTCTATTTRLYINVNAGSAATSVYPSAVAIGPASTVATDPDLRSTAGYLDGVADRIPLITPTVSVLSGSGATYAGGVYTVPAGIDARFRLGVAGIVENDVGTIRLAVADERTVLQVGFYLTDGNALIPVPASVGTPQVRRMSRGVYQCRFVARGYHTGGFNGDFSGLVLGIYNPTGAAITVRDVAIAKGTALPPTVEAPAAVKAYVAEQLGTGGSIPALPGPTVDAWGDSLTQGIGTTPWPQQLAARLGVTVNNRGIAAQTSVQIAARQGGAPALVNVAGNSIPASGSVALTAWSVPLATYFSALAGLDPLDVTIAGVPGQIASGGNFPGNSNSPGALTFTRTTPGSAVSVNPNIQVVPAMAVAGRARHQVLIYGRNDMGYSDAAADAAKVIGFVRQSIAYLTPHEKRVLVGSVLTAVSDTAPQRAHIASVNALIRAAFPREYVELDAAPTAEEMATVGFTPDGTDNTDIAAGLIPSRMRNGGGDLLHLNTVGNALWALRVWRQFVWRGWVVS